MNSLQRNEAAAARGDAGEGAVPNPGSPQAYDKGCTCPVMDNSHGKGWYGNGTVFVMRRDCPLHGDAEITPPGATHDPQ